MEELITNLEEWADNIEYDSTADWMDEEKERREYVLQAIKIRQAIGILQSVGTNNNIPNQTKS